MARQHVRAALDRRFELGQRFLELARKGYVHDRRHPVAERAVRKPRVIALDHPALFQLVEPPGTGGLREADLFGERGIRYPAVLLERVENGEIDPVQRHEPPFLRKPRLFAQVLSKKRLSDNELRKHIRSERCSNGYIHHNRSAPRRKSCASAARRRSRTTSTGLA